MTHTLVVGGSGMLAGMCIARASRGETVSVVARDIEKLITLAAQVKVGAGRGARRAGRDQL